MSALERHRTVLTDPRKDADHLGIWTGECPCEMEPWQKWLILAPRLVLFVVTQADLTDSGVRGAGLAKVRGQEYWGHSRAFGASDEKQYRGVDFGVSQPLVGVCPELVNYRIPLHISILLCTYT